MFHLQQERHGGGERERHCKGPGHFSAVQLCHPAHLHGSHQARGGFGRPSHCRQADWRYCGMERVEKQNTTKAQDCSHKGYRLLIYNNAVHCCLCPVFFIEQRQHAERYGGKMHYDTEKTPLGLTHQSWLKCFNFNFMPSGIPTKTKSNILPHYGYRASAPTYFGECFLFSAFLISADQSNKTVAVVTLITISCRDARHISWYGSSWKFLKKNVYNCCQEYSNDTP